MAKKTDADSQRVETLRTGINKLTLMNPTKIKREVNDRIALYLDKCPPAISGSRGHDTTFTVACKLVENFGLGENDLHHWLSIYNQKCQPAWSAAELRHKVQEALKHATPKVDGLPDSGRKRVKSFTEIQADIERERKQQLELRAKASLNQITERHSIDPIDMMRTSPFNLVETCFTNDWRYLLRLYKPGDVLWIGRKYDSCGDDAPEWKKKRCRGYFRTVSEWMKLDKAPAPFTTPGVFKAGSHSRCDENVISKPYLVVESDHLTKTQMLGVIRWLQSSLRLRAIVDTGGKSLHGWFEHPSAKIEAELRNILPGLCCDDSLFARSQPCRLPGVIRDGKTCQYLLWLDLEGVQ